MNTTRTWKRLLSIVLAVVLLLSVAPVGPLMDVVTHAATTEKMTVYFQNNWKWTDVKCYYWTSSGNNGWPGASMTKVENDGTHDIYSFEIPAGTTGIIFNGIKNDGSGNRDQSPNIENTNIKTGVYYYMTWSNGNSYATKSYTPPAKEYNVTYSLTNMSTNGANKANDGADYTATLSASTGYTLPASITVTVGGSTISGYTYNSSTGALSIPKAKITGAIKITAAGVQSVSGYKVTFNGSNVTSNGATTVAEGEAYTATLTPASGYNLPSSVIVTVGGNTISGYIYSNGSLNIPSTYITGDVEITAIGVAKPQEGLTIYLKTGANWKKDNARFAVYYWADGSSGQWMNMTATGEADTYTATLPENCTNVIFGRFDPNNSTNDWNCWNRTGDLVVPHNNAMFTVGDDQWGDANSGATGTWTVYSGSGGSGGSTTQKDTYYVNTDIVDYLNDYRVNAGAALGYSNDNQGVWMDTAGNPVFSYLNYIISCQEGYSYPLYFGNLLFVSSRYGVKYTPFTVGDYNTYNSYRQAGKQNLNNWNTGANVALNNNNTYNAVVQGLVGSKLDQYGQLMDAKTDKQLFYFDKTSIESWKTSDGTKNIAAYYQNLQFPFKATYNPNTHVTTYSYDSATDQSVFIDYDHYSADSKSNPMYTSSNYAKDQNNNKGFFPLNKPGDSSNDTNYAFGVKFTIDFTVSDDGVIVSADGTETPVEFSFTGDDDVWVFIDGYLVLDMGGAHTMASGTIDFQDLSATVSQAAQVSSTYFNPSYYYDSYNYGGDGEQREGLTIQNNVKTAFPAELAADFQNEYTTGISQVHTLTMFYMERGTIESNMSIEFSMSPIPTGLTVSKDIENVNPGLNAAVQDDDEFSFTIEATDKDGNGASFDGYDLTDHGSITTNMTTNNNSVVGVRGDRYANNFTYGNLPAFTAGTSFVITEGAYSNKFSGTRWVVYEYTDSYQQIASGNGVVADFDTDEDSSGNYAVNFVNILKTGTLTLTKKYLDTLINTTGTKFEFQIQLDLDGKGYKPYPGLVYDVYEGNTLVSEGLVCDEDGSIYLEINQTAKIEGIPVGTLYKIVEVDESALWEQASATNASGEVTTEGQVIEATFVNKTTSTTLAEKVIYVEAGKDTAYTIKDGSSTITVKSALSGSDELTVSVASGKVTVNGSKTNTKYSFDYAGTYANGSYVSGKVTVYTFSATNKTYVFDFGMSAELATSAADGLFTGAVFNNTNVSGETAVLKSLSGGSKTSITTTLNKTFGDNNSYGSVTFKPTGFMDQVENYTYTVNITAAGKTLDASNPETGVVLTGTIKVMPANTVYYEDNFNVNGSSSTNKIVFSANAPAVNFGGVQSIDQSTNYGYDDAYKNGYEYSGGSATELTHGQYAYFTFSGTGFDLISRTNGASAGFAIYVFAGGPKAEYVTYMSTFKGATPSKLVFVDTYYNNGDLYQVPVASVRLEQYGQYTVYVQALSTTPVGQANGRDSVEIDGVRIYDPLPVADRTNYLKAEQNTTVDELRVLYGIDNVVSLAGRNQNNVFVGLGKQAVVQQALEKAGIVENMDGDEIVTAADVESIYLHGPNNEMYLPTSFGIAFSYTVNSSDWTLQLGARTVTDSSTAKSITVYARKSGSGSYTAVTTIDLTSANAMYYDLTDYLGSYKTTGQTYDIVIISNSAFESNEFVSLTTVKHSGITLS